MKRTRHCRLCGGNPTLPYLPLHLAVFHNDKVAAKFLGYTMGAPIWFDADRSGRLKVGVVPKRRGKIDWVVNPPMGEPLVHWDQPAKEATFRFAVELGAPPHLMPDTPRGMTVEDVLAADPDLDDDDDGEEDDEDDEEWDDDDWDEFWND